jgi:hypothetical protein
VRFELCHSVLNGRNVLTEMWAKWSYAIGYKFGKSWEQFRCEENECGCWGDLTFDACMTAFQWRLILITLHMALMIA